MIIELIRAIRRASIVIGALCCIAENATAAEYTYIARTVNTFSTTVQVKVGNLYWTCKQKVCSIKGSWPAPEVEACQMLAEKVGAIYFYGYSRAQLNKDQLYECNKGRSLAGETLDVPPISAPVETVIRDTAGDRLPPIEVGGDPLVNTLGPQIQNFDSDSGCPYPGRDMAGMSYAVHAVPDGSAVARIEILRVLPDGSTQVFYETPTDDRSPLASARNIQDRTLIEDVSRYMLRATDRRNRTSTRVIDSPYWSGGSSFTLGPGFTVTRDGSLYRYEIPYETIKLAIAGQPSVDIRFATESRSASHPEILGGVVMTYRYPDGVEAGPAPPPFYFREPIRGHIYFSSRGGVYPDGRIDNAGYAVPASDPITEWSINVRVPLVSPDNCAAEVPRAISKSLRGDVSSPSAVSDSPPPTEDEGVWHDVLCGCREPYDQENPMSRTRAFTASIRACATSQFGAHLQCAIAGPRLNPTGTAGRNCFALTPAVLSEVDEASCNPRIGNLLILENNR